jgi:hypothetical protein
MSDLSSFRRQPADRPVRSSHRLEDFRDTRPAAPKGPPDRNRCPAGWDADLWHLTLLFEQYARADRIELRAGRPVIYAELQDLASRYRLPQQAKENHFRQEVAGCVRRHHAADRADRCWLHWPPNDPGQQRARYLTWVQMAEVIMAEFWSRVQDEFALDQFRQHFSEYGNDAWRHWRSLLMIRQISEQPKVRRPVMRRRTSGATMDDASKEG